MTRNADFHEPVIGLYHIEQGIDTFTLEDRVWTPGRSRASQGRQLCVVNGRLLVPTWRDSGSGLLR
ncbi:hypothetical protein ACFZAV_44995 [Streptomyces sp. NPDC008343]|uniref:hypothetical protein n=1 Tax=Streptomyces sp. NPDC008343 TaxID=3364828 RepID=UPI0036E59F0D